VQAASRVLAYLAPLHERDARAYISLNGTGVPFTAASHPRIHSSSQLIKWNEVSAIGFVGGNEFGRSMKKTKRRPSVSGLGRAVRERDVQFEIKSFLSALASYEDRFGREPDLSFEQHLFQLVAAHRLAHGAARHRG